MEPRTSGLTEAMRALRRGIQIVTLGALLGACAETGGLPDGDWADAGGSGAAADTELGPVGGSAGSGSGGGASDDPGGAGSGGYAGAGFVGTGGFVGVGTGGGAAAGTPATGGTSGIVPTANVACNPIAAGTSTVVVDGSVRTFSVQMPANTSRMALLFLWHGWMQAPTDFANEIVYDVPRGQWVPFDPNAFPMPLMIVTPWDLKLIPPAGLDWDIASGALDFPFFEGMLHCIQQQFDIDDTRIYSFGFSAGAVFTNLLSAKYPRLFAATISESGAWFNDPAQWSDVSVPIMQWQWPAFDPADGGNVLLTHGGPNDYATVISLESTNQKAVPFLYNHGRTVIDCAHTFGHTLDPDLTQQMYYDYMWAHQRGGPPLSAMVPGFPAPAHPVGSTTCTFHPYP
jgi:poly(3-hydroxybutyrate) depolymerase